MNRIHQRLHEEAKLLQHQQKKFPSLFFIIVGILSIIWFLIRSGTKPSRITYPCQRFAATNSSIFIAWIATLLFTTTLGRVFRRKQQFFYPFFVVSGALVLVAGYRYFVPKNNLLSPPAQGAGTSTVVWVNDSRAATGWSSNSVTRVNQTAADEMMLLGITRLTGTANAGNAWDKIFRDHNGGTAYQSGEKIAIKLNFNNSGNPSLHNPNVASINALIKTLVDAGVPQNNIILYDSSRDFVSDFAPGVRARFPNVQINPSEARSYCDNVFGTRLTCLLNNVTYVINMPLLRTHYYCGVTLAFKNHLGSTETPSTFHYTFLESEISENGLVQLNSSPNIKNKTVLVVTDAIYGLKSSGPDAEPTGEKGITNPFPNAYFLSTDPVANDSVAIDYIASRGGDFRAYDSPVEPRVYLAAAAAAGLGNYDTNASFNYSRINLIRCTNGDCAGGGSIPTPSPTPTPPPSPTPPASPEVCMGDLDENGQVNLLDYTILVSHFMETGSNIADINQDQIVNLLDYTLLVQHFFKNCSN